MPSYIRIPSPSAAELAPYSPEPVKLAALLAVLAELESGPPTTAAHRTAADWLDRHVEPLKVAPHDERKFPAWALRSWLDHLWCDANDPWHNLIDEDGTPLKPPGRHFEWDEAEFWDHHPGVVRLYGVTALLCEPYNFEPDHPRWQSTDYGSAPSILRDVGRRCGGTAIWSPRATWHPTASRVMIFPRPDRFPAVLAHRPAQLAFYRHELFSSSERAVELFRGRPVSPWYQPLKPRTRLPM